MKTEYKNYQAYYCNKTAEIIITDGVHTLNRQQFYQVVNFDALSMYLKGFVESFEMGKKAMTKIENKVAVENNKDDIVSEEAVKASEPLMEFGKQKILSSAMEANLDYLYMKKSLDNGGAQIEIWKDKSKWTARVNIFGRVHNIEEGVYGIRDVMVAIRSYLESMNNHTKTVLKKFNELDK